MGYLQTLTRQSLQSLLLFFVIAAVAINLIHSLPSKDQLTLIYRNPNLALNLKYRLKIGSPLYEYLVFLQQNLPEDAVVAEPPQMHPWAYTGNGAFLNYFLYPRRLVQVNTPTDPIPLAATYSLLIWGESHSDDKSLYGWPKTDISSYEITYFQKDPPWGIIKLKK